MCHALQIQFEATHQTSWTTAGCRFQTSLHINPVSFSFLLLNLFCEHRSHEWGGAALDANPLLYFFSASHSFGAFSSDPLRGITHGGLLQ